MSFGPASAVVVLLDPAQVILQNLRSIAEVRFRLPASLGDGITCPQHQIETPGSFALMSQNRLHFILLMPFDHNGSGDVSSAFSNSLDRWNLMRFDT